MRRIDEQFLETPFLGLRHMTWHLRNNGHLANKKRIRWLMRLIGLAPITKNPTRIPRSNLQALVMNEGPQGAGQHVCCPEVELPRENLDNSMLVTTAIKLRNAMYAQFRKYPCGDGSGNAFLADKIHAPAQYRIYVEDHDADFR
ncbi:IS3 family transposase [Chachezhania antarctica]|uniref:IS3 family transposase n=1 Tax=Chachezhania antarctica TaxID=2340860 RepID=UPI000EB21AE4